MDRVAKLRRFQFTHFYSTYVLQVHFNLVFIKACGRLVILLLVEVQYWSAELRLELKSAAGGAQDLLAHGRSLREVYEGIKLVRSGIS